MAQETKAEKRMAQLRNNEQREQEETRARNMKNIIQAQKQQAAQQREINFVER